MEPSPSYDWHGISAFTNAQPCLTGSYERVDPYLKMSKFWPVSLVCFVIVELCYRDSAAILPNSASGLDPKHQICRLSLQIRIGPVRCVLTLRMLKYLMKPSPLLPDRSIRHCVSSIVRCFKLCPISLPMLSGNRIRIADMTIGKFAVLESLRLGAVLASV